MAPAVRPEGWQHDVASTVRDLVAPYVAEHLKLRRQTESHRWGRGDDTHIPGPCCSRRQTSSNLVRPEAYRMG